MSDVIMKYLWFIICVSVLICVWSVDPFKHSGIGTVVGVFIYGWLCGRAKFLNMLKD